MSIKTLDQKETIDGKIALTIQQDISKEIPIEDLTPVPAHISLLLEIFCSHTDRPVYALKHLPPDFIAGLLARYSKSGKPLVAVFIELCEEMELTNEIELRDLVIAMKEVDKFNNCPAITAMHENFTKKGHESIKKLSDGIPVAIDSCSFLAASTIFNGRTGFQGMERSTRYQNFFEPNYVRNLFSDQQINMRFDFFMSTAYKTAKLVFDDVYAALLSLYPYDEDSQLVNEVCITEKQWKGWIKNRAFDCARYALPVAGITGLGVVGNVMAFERICEKLVSSDSEEMFALGGLIGEAVSAVSPTVFTMPHPNRQDMRYNNFDDEDIAGFRELILNSVANESKTLMGPPTSDVDLCRIALDQSHMSSEDSMLYYAAVAIGRQLGLPPDVVYHWMCSPWFKQLASLEKPMPGFSDSKEHKIISHIDFALRVLGKFTGEFNEDNQMVSYRSPIYKQSPFDPEQAEIVGFKKLPRFYELTNLTFDMVIDFGAWRDLNRHGIITNIQWPLVPNVGYAVPDHFNLCSDTTKDVYQSLFAMSVDMWETIVKKYGVFKGQYAGLMMWNQRRWIRANVREIDYMIQLRSRWAGHHSYRRAAQLLHKRVISLWPTLKQMLRCDNKDYIFGMLPRTPNDHKNANNGMPAVKEEYIPMSQRKPAGEN